MAPAPFRDAVGRTTRHGTKNPQQNQSLPKIFRRQQNNCCVRRRLCYAQNIKRAQHKRSRRHEIPSNRNILQQRSRNSLNDPLPRRSVHPARNQRDLRHIPRNLWFTARRSPSYQKHQNLSWKPQAWMSHHQQLGETPSVDWSFSVHPHTYHDANHHLDCPI